jgi:hypothetical protein
MTAEAKKSLAIACRNEFVADHVVAIPVLVSGAVR